MKMVVKEAKKDTCKKVKLRRDAITGHSNAPLVFSPFPSRLASHLSASGVPPATNLPISPLMSPDDSSSPDTASDPDNASETKNGTGYQRISVDWILNSPLQQVCPLLRLLDNMRDADLILEMLLHYSLEIKGLPDCPGEDLPLAVYFFLEDTFGIRSEIRKCWKVRLYEGKMDVVVVFDTIRMKYDILKKDELLEGAEVRIVNNHRRWTRWNPHHHLSDPV